MQKSVPQGLKPSISYQPFAARLKLYPITGLPWVVASVLNTLHGLGCEYPPLLPLERRAACSAPPDMISLLFYCLVLHTSYLAVVRVSIAMLSVGAWSGLAPIAGVALLPRISRITLVTRSSGVASVPPVASLACIPGLSLLSGLPLRAFLSGRSRLSLRCRCCRCCLLWRWLATDA
jgi:hypothetical protein